MKKLFVLLALSMAASGAVANEPTALPMDESSMVSVLATPLSDRPGGFTGREVFRLFNNKTKNHLSYHEMPSNWEDLGWRKEGTLGFVSTTYFADARPMYVCYMWSKDTNWDHKYFSTNDPGCEGQNQPNYFGYFEGYLASTQLPGTVPLYRCYIELTKDHFDTLSSNCEGEALAQFEKLLGYIFL